MDRVSVFRVTVAVVSVSGSIGSLNVAVMGAFRVTPVAPKAGDVAVTWGGVTSANAPVVKLQTKGLTMALPARSFTALVTVAV
jgi:hypothetical protein